MPGDGFLNLLKPPGMTSHDVVAFVRRALGLRRVGHLGTLDPAAAGVLPVSLGRATRLSRFAAGRDKAYRAQITFGLTSDSFDAEGRVTAISDSSALGRDGLLALTGKFIGEIEQIPPRFSAARVAGERAHALVRRGVSVSLRPRRVRIFELELVAFEPGHRARALFDVVCSAGTYLRTLASDLGEAAGCGAYLSFLVRTRVGRFELSDALTLEELRARCGGDDLGAIMLPPDWPLDHLPVVSLDGDGARRFLQGRSVAAEVNPVPVLRVYGPGLDLLGLGEIAVRGQLQPRVVLLPQQGDAR